MRVHRGGGTMPSAAACVLVHPPKNNSTGPLLAVSIGQAQQARLAGGKTEGAQRVLKNIKNTLGLGRGERRRRCVGRPTLLRRRQLSWQKRAGSGGGQLFVVAAAA